ncbi:MAG: hypothetical protein ACLU9S_05365 [Oscillospiraceae bacterium]
MKRITAIILSLAMVFALTSCGGQSGTGALRPALPRPSALRLRCPGNHGPGYDWPQL